MLADDMTVSPYRQGSRWVGCTGSSEHSPHLLREGHMIEGAVTAASVVFDIWGGVGRMNLRGKVGVELKKLNFKFNKSTSHVIMSTHDHIHTTL